MRASHGILWALALAPLLAACSGDRVTGAPAPGDDDASASSAASAAQGRLWTQDDEWAVMADTMPGGFAGVYLERGAVVVLAARPERGPELVDRLRGSRALSPLLRGRPARVQNAAYDFRQLKDWYDALLGVIDGSSFVSLDIDETRNRIAVGIAGPSRRGAVVAAAQRAGIPPQALQVTETGEIVPEAYLYDYVRPVIGGLRILPYGCTLGFNVQHHSYGASFVTNSHCTAAIGSVNGQVETQGGARIGVETWDRAVFTGTGCPSGRVCRRSDAALFKYDDSVSITQGGIALTTGHGSLLIGSLSPAIVSLGVDSYCIEGYPCTMFVVGDSVNKVGTTTGWTAGTVAATCSLVTYPSYITPSNVSLPCQVAATYHSDGGDSGSPVFRLQEYYATTLLGIHHSSGSNGLRYFSPLAAVRQDLNPLSWDPQCSVRVTGGSAWAC
ncbi:MAG TPA: hypothetical protein VK358_12445 [Longimicrobium sp.]|nr:hypothetical protein [Longimicrobium sp.]